MDIWLANEPPAPQVIPMTTQEKPLLKDEDFIIDEVIEIKPFFLEGSVEEFDPVRRAIDLAKKLPRNLCGSYQPFDRQQNKKVTLTYSEAIPIGHMIKLKGEISINNSKGLFTGFLNAKSDQLELIPLTNHIDLGLDKGGAFIGLQGANLLTWKSSRLDNPGGRLELKESCDSFNLSEAFNFRSFRRVNETSSLKLL